LRRTRPSRRHSFGRKRVFAHGRNVD
jgi:hypothetical protein